MKKEERARFAAMLATLGIALRADIDEPTIHLYFRALRDVPMDLLERSGVELAKSCTFMPKPAEFRVAVDAILDKRGAGPKGQALLPGDVGEFRCATCDNTGWVEAIRPCPGEGRCRAKDPAHVHTFAARCQDETCLRWREAQAARKKRYSSQEAR